MKILLFLLGLIFFFIYFLFSFQEIKGGLFGDFFYPAQAYIIFALLCILSLVRITPKIQTTHLFQENIFKKYSFSRADALGYIKSFFDTYMYYIATLLFYLSFFLILKETLGGIDIPIIFLCFNILVTGLYFFRNSFVFFHDLIRVNTLIVSLYYTFRAGEYITGFGEGYFVIGILNIIFLSFLFSVFIQSSRNSSYISGLTSYTVFFFFLQILAILFAIFGNILVLVSLLSAALGALFLLQTSLISQFFMSSKQVVRIWGLIAAYISIIFSSILVFGSGLSVLSSLGILGFFSYILFKFHERFQNYISLLFSSYASVCVGVPIYYFLTPAQGEQKYFFLLCFFYACVFLGVEKFSITQYEYDKYFYRFISVLVNAIGVIYFLFFIEISILKFAFLLFGECLYFLYSYYTLRRIKNN